MKQNRVMHAALILVLVAGAVQGCASNQIRRTSYKLLGSYSVAVETGADIAESPSTPTPVVDAVKAAKDVASPSMQILHDNLNRYADLQDQIKGIKAAGGEPPLVMLQQAEAALGALQKAYIDALPLVTQLIKIVEGF